MGPRQTPVQFRPFANCIFFSTAMALASVADAAAAIRHKMADFSRDPVTAETDSRARRRVFLGLLNEACDLVRSRDSGHPDYEAAMNKANEIINEGVEMAYGELEFDFLQSFAHSEKFPVLLGPQNDEKTFCV